jgi:hypothetical protein
MAQGDPAMSLTTLAWMSMAFYAIHMIEEFMFDWRNWARAVIGLPVEWPDFYVTNGVVVALGIAQAMLADALPLAPLSFAGLMLVNAVFFHILPMVWTKGRFSPGAFTATVLLLPMGVAVFWKALASGAASTSTALLGLLIGALLMAYPVVMLHLRSKPYFRQT